MGTGIRTPAV